jgi:hypothetical protein
MRPKLVRKRKPLPFRLTDRGRFGGSKRWRGYWTHYYEAKGYERNLELRVTGSDRLHPAEWVKQWIVHVGLRDEVYEDPHLAFDRMQELLAKRPKLVKRKRQ